MSIPMILKGASARLGIRNYPLSLTYEITHRCNLSCTYCDRNRALPNEMKPDEIFSALDQFIALGTEYVSLDGGEPLLHEQIDEVVEHLTQRGIEVAMNTNGILVPKKIDTVKKLLKVKISLDGPEPVHDAMRGKGAFKKAVNGAKTAMMSGTRAEFTCVVGCHNAAHIEELIDLAAHLNINIVFQPLMNSLFLDSKRDGSAFQTTPEVIRSVFSNIESYKKESEVIANGWASLKHFRSYPEDTPLPCSAGRVIVTMDPEGVLFKCSQINRNDRSINVVKLGTEKAFRSLPLKGCQQCWCARLVECNHSWGCSLHKMMPPLKKPEVINIKNLIENTPSQSSRNATCSAS